MRITKKDYSQEHILHTKELRENISDLVSRVDGNKASLIIIDGGLGEGKTTLSVQVADAINEIRGQDKISLAPDNYPQFAQGGEEFVGKLGGCYRKKYPVIIYDEAGDFNRRSALTKFNQVLNRTFETFRGFKIVVVLVLPSMRVLDQDLFDKEIPRLLLHCYKRTKICGIYKAYSLYRMHYLRRNMEKLTVKSFAYNQVDPNFYGYFYDLSPERSKQLDILSTEAKLRELESGNEKLSELSSANTKGVYSVEMIANHYKVGKPRVGQYIYVRNISPVKVMRGKNYYTAEVLEGFKNYRKNKKINSSKVDDEDDV